ncbi:MAG: hypothetical protein U1D26_01185 [Patescibacteria group bacterium]|nr:hypothetical protein [bacterium]MDZ4227071.1 hypothetical protein [Patescibacteria group bacterium]
MQKGLTYIAWAFALIALISCVAVVYFAQMIANQEVEHADARTQADAATTREAARIRAGALVRDTVLPRGKLESYLQADVIEIVDLVKAAGKSAGVSLQLSSALPESFPAVQPVSGPSVNAIGFVVQGQGSFSSLMHAERLFESLPVAASVNRLDISRNPGSKGSSGDWNMNVYIRVLTTAPISS